MKKADKSASGYGGIYKECDNHITDGRERKQKHHIKQSVSITTLYTIVYDPPSLLIQLESLKRMRKGIRK